MCSWKVFLVAVLLMGAVSAANAVDYLAVSYDTGGGGLKVYDSATGALVSNLTLPGGGNSMNLQFTPNGSLYAGRYLDPSALETDWDVTKYSVADWSVQEQWVMPTHRTVGMCYGPDGKLYIGRVDGGFYKLGMATGSTPSFVDTAVLGGDLREMTADINGYVFGAGSGWRQIGAYDVNANAQLPPAVAATRDINLQPTYPISVALGPDATGDGKSDLYVGYWAIAAGQSTIDIYNGQTGAFSGVFDDLANYGQDGCAITSIKFSGDGTTAYFTSWQGGTVFKKVGSNAATAFITGVGGTRGISLSNEYRGVVPEPGSVVALCSGLLALVGARIRRRR